MDPNTPIVVVNQTGSNWGIFWFVIFIFVLLIVIGVSVFWFFGNSKSSVLHDGCTQTCDCSHGLVCDNSKCKSPIGGSCRTWNDCTTGATACLNNVCIDKKLGGIGERPPCQAGLVDDRGSCKIPLGGHCQNVNQCVDAAASCNAGKCSKHSESSCTSCSSGSSNSSASSKTKNSSKPESSKSSSSKTPEIKVEENSETNSKRIINEGLESVYRSISTSLRGSSTFK